MPAFKNITGQIFGRLTAIERMPRGYHSPKRVFWRCQCKCGNERILAYTTLVHGKTRSCGCLRKEAYRECPRTHGKSRTPTFAIWCGMLARCSNPNVIVYGRYGGRGIKVCERWHDFSAFIADMGERPSLDHSLDRIDNAGNYEPGNVRWATTWQQASNKRNTLMISAFGRTLHLAEWSRQVGITSQTIHKRLKRGWPPERALTR